jgi:hypothetical protein
MTTQYWITGASGDWSTGADWLSGVSPTSADDAVINNSNSVTVNGTVAANSLAMNNSDLNVSGSLTLGTSITLDGSSQLSLSGGSVSAQSIVSDDVPYTSGSLYGYGTINAAVSGPIQIAATGGILDITGSITNDYEWAYIYSNATLELSGNVSIAVSFLENATLKLDTPTAFTGSILNIAIGDTIDLVGITANSGSYNGSTLIINETNGQQLTYSVNGGVSGDILTLANDNHGGTDVYWVQPLAPTVSVSGASTTLKVGQTDPITLTFNEAVTGFNNADVSVSGGMLSPISQTDATHYTATFTPTAGVNGQTATIQVVASGTGTVWTDLAGNPGTASNVLSITEDTLSPTVAVSGATSTLKAGQTDLITFTFNELVTGFDNADVSVSGGTLSPISQTDTTHYTATFTPTAGVDTQTATIQVLASGTSSWTDLAGNPGTASNVLSITEDTLPPTSTITTTLLNDTGVSHYDLITYDGDVTVTGTASEQVSSVEIWNAFTNTQVGTAKIGTDGESWSFSGTLTEGNYQLYAKLTDLAGNAGQTAIPQTTIDVDQTAPVPTISGEVVSTGKTSAVTLTGTTGEANDTIAVYDGKTLLGTTATANDGTWSFGVGTPSNVVHTYTATATDVAGNVGLGSNEAIYGSTKADTLVGTSGNDVIMGNGGNDKITGGIGADLLTGGSGNVTFVYNAAADSTPTSHDTITDFRHNHDTIDFTNIPGINANHGIPLFQGKLTGNLTLNAHSVAFLEVGGNTEVLVNTTATAENAGHADMEIVLVGVNLGLTATDFHHV